VGFFSFDVISSIREEGGGGRKLVPVSAFLDTGHEDVLCCHEGQLGIDVFADHKWPYLTWTLKLAWERREAQER